MIQIKLSSYNSTVSAFALFTFEPSFFTRYDLGEQYGDTRALGLSVTGKVSPAWSFLVRISELKRMRMGTGVMRTVPVALGCCNRSMCYISDRGRAGG